MTKRVKPITRREILDRLANGPAEMIELGRTSCTSTKARKVAKTLCAELIDEGLIRLIHIGGIRQYILNTKEAEREALQLCIDGKSKLDASSGCVLWAGFLKGGQPAMFTSLLGDKAVKVRRLLWNLHKGDLGANEVIRMQPDCDDVCINPAHMTKIKKGSDYVPTAATKAKISLTQGRKKAKGILHADLIRSSDKTAAELAKDLGMTDSNVRYIRRGDTFKLQANNPWQGLGAR